MLKNAVLMCRNSFIFALQMADRTCIIAALNFINGLIQ